MLKMLVEVAEGGGGRRGVGVDPEAGKCESDMQNSWLQDKHAKLYSGLKNIYI